MNNTNTNVSVIRDLNSWSITSGLGCTDHWFLWSSLIGKESGAVWSNTEQSGAVRSSTEQSLIRPVPYKRPPNSPNSGISLLLSHPESLDENKITKSEEVAQKLNICGFPLWRHLCNTVKTLFLAWKIGQWVKKYSKEKSYSSPE